MIRTLEYGRVSTKEQDDYGFGLDVQRAENAEYAARHDMNIIERFSDDISGDTHTRPGLSALMERLEKELARGNEVAVLIHRPDRLARKSWIAEMFMDEWHSRGVAVHFQNMGRIDNTPEARFQVAIMCSVGELNKRQLLRGMDAARRQKVIGGSVHGQGFAPYGYRYDDARGKKRTMIIDETEAATVRLIYDWYVYERLGAGAIARRLSEMRVPTSADRNPDQWMRSSGFIKRVAGYGQWNPGVVHSILRKPVYSGRMPQFYKSRVKVEIEGETRTRVIKRAWNDPNVIFIEVPAIVPRELWDAAQRIMDSNVAPRHNRAIGEYLVAGHVWCKCGYKCSGTSSHGEKRGWKTSYYYRCAARGKRHFRPCDLPHFRSEDVDFTVWQWLAALFNEPERLNRNLEQMRAETEGRKASLLDKQAALEKQIRDTSEATARLLGLYVDGTFDRSMLETQKGILTERQRAAELALDEINAEIASIGPTDDELMSIGQFAGEIRQRLGAAGFEHKRHLISLLRVKVTLRVIEDEKFLDVECALPGTGKRLPVRKPGAMPNDGTTSLHSYMLQRYTIVRERIPLARAA